MSKWAWNGDGAEEPVMITDEEQQTDAQLVSAWESFAWDSGSKGLDINGESHREMRERVFAQLAKLPARVKAHHLAKFATLGIKPPAPPAPAKQQATK